MILIISAVSVVNDEIIFNVALRTQIIIVRYSMIIILITQPWKCIPQIFMKISAISANYFLCTVVSKVSVVSVVSDEIISGIQNQRS